MRDQTFHWIQYERSGVTHSLDNYKKSVFKAVEREKRLVLQWRKTFLKTLALKSKKMIAGQSVTSDPTRKSFARVRVRTPSRKMT
jgi:hypothetical protein